MKRRREGVECEGWDGWEGVYEREGKGCERRGGVGKGYMRGMERERERGC